MKNIFLALLFIILTVSCKEEKTNSIVIKEENKFNQDLANELEEIRQTDQFAADIARDEYEKLSEQEWKTIQDSIHLENQKRIKEISEQYGFVGHDLVGERGSQSFWLVVQHADNNPEFQKKILEKMKIQVLNENADPVSFGLLTDRVKLNTGQKQVYGSQVTYNWEICQAIPRDLADRENVNKRRSEIGLEPIEEYLNRLSEMHYKMNETIFKKNGLNGPTLYKTE